MMGQKEVEQMKSVSTLDEDWSPPETIAEPQERNIPKRRVYCAGKRIFDIVFSGATMLALSPLMAVIAVLVHKDDPKVSCIYAQQRVGKEGAPFVMYKFRTMIADAEKQRALLESQNEKDGPVFKIRNDPRVTPIGRVLRKLSLDELPQLWNVFKGDMSIVGPRPALPNEVACYEPWQRERLCVKPGLTCYWQVVPRRDTISFEEWMRMDIRYIEECSWLLDLKLIVQTVKIVVTAQGQ